MRGYYQYIPEPCNVDMETLCYSERGCCQSVDLEHMEAARRMRWENVQYKREPVSSPAIERFVGCARQIFVNGGVIIERFGATDSDLFDEAMREYPWGDELFIAFLGSPTVNTAVPELTIQNVSAENLKLRSTIPLAMEGELTHLLLRGGAYHKFEGSIDEARTIARGLMEAMFVGERIVSAHVGVSEEPWTAWFYDCHWDVTYVVCDWQERSFWLLCLTDTD